MQRKKTWLPRKLVGKGGEGQIKTFGLTYKQYYIYNG